MALCCKNSFVPIMAALMLSMCCLAGSTGIHKPYQVVILLVVLASGWWLLLQEKHHEILGIVLLVLGLARVRCSSPTGEAWASCH